MKKGIIGKKVGMTQIFDEVGNAIPVTVIQAGPCTVSQRKTAEKDGYEAVQLGFEDVKEKHATKAEIGHFSKNGLTVKKHLKEFRLEDCSSYNVGDVVSVETFAVGEKVDAKVTSIDNKNRKVTLSIKAREIAEEKEAMEEYGSTDSGASLGDILGAALAKKKEEK